MYNRHYIYLTALSNRIRELRARNNLTQAELAEKVHVTRQTILAIEKGDCVPSLELGLKIAQAFLQTVEYVFSLDKKAGGSLDQEQDYDPSE